MGEQVAGFKKVYTAYGDYACSHQQTRTDLESSEDKDAARNKKTDGRGKERVSLPSLPAPALPKLSEGTSFPSEVVSEVLLLLSRH